MRTTNWGPCSRLFLRHYYVEVDSRLYKSLGENKFGSRGTVALSEALMCENNRVYCLG